MSRKLEQCEPNVKHNLSQSMRLTITLLCFIMKDVLTSSGNISGLTNSPAPTWLIP